MEKICIVQLLNHIYNLNRKQKTVDSLSSWYLFVSRTCASEGPNWQVNTSKTFLCAFKVLRVVGNPKETLLSFRRAFRILFSVLSLLQVKSYETLSVQIFCECCSKTLKILIVGIRLSISFKICMPSSFSLYTAICCSDWDTTVDIIITI